MSCDLCGSSGDSKLVRIEGIAYRACERCQGYGTEVREAPTRIRSGKRSDERVVRSDAGNSIRSAREKSGVSMDAFAKQLAVKKSDIHAWETGHRTPTIEMAERIGKRLHIDLLSEPEAYDDTISKTASGGGMTIADLLKKK